MNETCSGLVIRSTSLFTPTDLFIMMLAQALSFKLGFVSVLSWLIRNSCK